VPDDGPLEHAQLPLLGAVSRAAWRSMPWPLDAWRPSRLASAAPWAVPPPWLEATRWWTQAQAEGPALRPESDAGLLVELAGGAARAFRGRRVGFELGGLRVRAELDSLWLDRRDDRYAGRLELRSVECDGLHVEALSVVADTVALTPPPKLVLTADGVELAGRAALEPVVAWLDRRIPGWDLSVVEGGHIQAVPRGGDKRFLVDAALRDGELEVELRALRWRRVTVRCPAWLRLTRKIRLPALPEGASLAEARRHGADVEFRLSVPTLGRSLDPGRLRDAILSAGSIP
jgi:hypothetical protein